MSEKVTKVQGEKGTDLRKQNNVFTSFPTDLSASFMAADAQVLIVRLGQGRLLARKLLQLSWTLIIRRLKARRLRSTLEKTRAATVPQLNSPPQTFFVSYIHLTPS